MKDRVSTKILDNGATRYGVYDETGKLLRYEYIKLEDEPSTEGDFFNKANMLPDSIPKLLGLKMPNPQVADALNVLANIGNLHVWERVQTNQAAGYNLSDVKTNGTLANGDLGYTRVALSYGSSVSVSSDGYVTIENETNEQFYATQSSGWPSLSGKFIRITDYAGNSSGSPSYANSDFQIGAVFYIPSGGNIAHNGSGRIYLTKYQIVTGYPAGTTTDYLTSTDPNAYPKQSAEGGQDAYYTLGDVVSGKFELVSDNIANIAYYKAGTGVTVSENGALTLTGATSVKIQSSEWSTIAAQLELLRGKYCSIINYEGGAPVFASFDVFYIPEDVVFTIPTKSNQVQASVSKYQPVTGHAAIPANTTITYLGQLGGGARIEVGSYVGTGKYGNRNPNTLTFEFEPKMLMIGMAKNSNNLTMPVLVPTSNGWGESFIWIKGQVVGSVNGYDINISNEGKTVSWYSAKAANYQCNAANSTYLYLAIG